MTELAGKVAIVTGGSAGIGLGIAAGLVTALGMYVIVRVVGFHWSGVLTHWYVLSPFPPA